MVITEVFKTKRDSIQKEIQRRRKLNTERKAIRRKGEEERFLLVEQERQKVKTRVKLRSIRDAGKPITVQTGKGIKRKSLFGSFRDFATDFSNERSAFAIVGGSQRDFPKAKPVSVKRTKRRSSRRSRRR